MSILSWCQGCCCSTTCGVIALIIIAALWFVSDRIPRLNVRGKHVVITGGSQGIGKELAKLMAARGANVTIMARKLDIINEALKEINTAAGTSGGRAEGVAADVGDRKAVTAAIDKCASQRGGLGALLSGGAGGNADSNIDVLVCCAGYARPGLIEDQPEDEYERTMRVNYLGCVYAVRAALPHMSAGGRIVLIGSMAGLTGVAGYTSYCPSKFAVRGLAEALTMELRPRGITVSLAVPPDVDTPGFAHENTMKPEETKVVDSGVFTPQSVAADIAAGIENWKWLITSGFDGFLLGTLCTGTAPIHSVPAAIFQGAITGLLRIVLLGYQKKFATDLQKIYNRKHPKGASALSNAAAGAGDRKSD